MKFPCENSPAGQSTHSPIIRSQILWASEAVADYLALVIVDFSIRVHFRTRRRADNKKGGIKCKIMVAAAAELELLKQRQAARVAASWQ